MRSFLTTATLLIGTALIAPPATAQTNVDVRVDRLEGQMRAVQRKVFPPVNGKLVQPEITASGGTTEQMGTPANSAVNDLTARVDALESQLSSLTGQVEQSQFKLRQLDEGFTAYKRATDARLKALEGTAAPATGGPIVDAPAATKPNSPATRPTTTTPPPVTATRPATTPAATPATTPAKDADHAKRLAAVEKPTTADPADDTYTYGFRLWSAKLYPEAEAQFKAVTKNYPQSRLNSRAQNMLGRTLLDSNRPNLAMLAFYENYRTNPKGDRAHESLYYLAQALTTLKKPASEICKVYDELDQVYPDKLNGAMKAGVTRGRATQKCGK